VTSITTTNHRPPWKEAQIMIRLIDNKLETALDTRDWLAGLQAEHEPDEDISHLVFVLDALIGDYRRVIEKKGKLSEDGFYRIRHALTLASILLEEHLADHADQLADWGGYGSTPVTVHHLIAEILNMCVDHFSESLAKGRMKNFQPLTDAELAAVLSIL
jgi:hypothetical protein